VKGQKFAIVVGIQNGQPYEIFGGHLNGFGFKFQQKKGKIIKVKRAICSGICEITIEDFSKQFTPTEQILFRMASMLCVMAFPFSLSSNSYRKHRLTLLRWVLLPPLSKEYIKDGTAIGQKCPSCGKELVYLEGCCSCPACGWSRCS